MTDKKTTITGRIDAAKTGAAPVLPKRCSAVLTNMKAAEKAFGDDRFVGPDECGYYLGCGKSKFSDMAASPDFPRPIKVGRLRRWHLSEIKAYAERLRA